MRSFIFLLSRSIYIADSCFFFSLSLSWQHAKSSLTKVSILLNAISGLKCNIFRLSDTAGVTVNEEAGKQDSVVEQYLCPRPLPPPVTRRAFLPSTNPTTWVIPHREAKWTLIEGAAVVGRWIEWGEFRIRERCRARGEENETVLRLGWFRFRLDVLPKRNGTCSLLDADI